MDALYGDLRSNTSPHVEPHLIPTAVLGARVPKEIRVAPKMSRDPPPRTLPPSVQHDMHPDPTDKPYDPAHPNNYQEIITERLFKQKAAALQKKQQEEGERHKRERERLHAMPPQERERLRGERLRITGQDAVQRRRQLEDHAPKRPRTGPPPDDDRLCAAKLLQKMGWQEGKGLGRDQQGITTPLIGQAVGRKMGRIVRSASVQLTPSPAYAPPSRVAVLTAVKEEMSQEFMDSVTDQASRLGNLSNVRIVQDSDFKLKVFLHYEDYRDASRGMRKITKYTAIESYNKKGISARFYPESAFFRHDLSL